MQGQLADARVRYTPDHPDVKRLQRQIEALSAKVGSDHGTGQVVANNPEYLAVQSQINATQREISALQQKRGSGAGQIYGFEAGMVAAPAVERDYVEMTRTRDVLRQQFGDIQTKLREADIARNLETEQKGDRFSQIRAPQIPDTPFWPNRTGIVLLGLVLGVALAIGLAAFAEAADPTVRGKQDLTGITRIPAIASVPVMLNVSDRRRQRLVRGSYAMVLVAATAFVAITAIRA